MKLKLEMPELLVLFSLFMYSQSFGFSVAAFCIGLFSRLTVYLIDYGTQIKKTEAINNSVDELGSALQDLFGVKKD